MSDLFINHNYHLYQDVDVITLLVNIIKGVKGEANGCPSKIVGVKRHVCIF